MLYKSIDIIVPTYNRPKDIKKFISEIVKQTYQNYKVIIIDDCGNHEIENFLPKDSNRFYFERLKKNSGQAYARNYAVSKSQGDIIIFMDDDAYFTEENSLETIISYFSSVSKMGCLMFDVKEPNRQWLSQRKMLQDCQELGNFIACGCAFKRKSFENISGFSPIFHSYGEETDISMQLIKNKDTVVFGKKVKLFHNYNPTERSLEWQKRFKFNSVRNDFLIVFTRYPVIYVLPYFFGKLCSHLFFCLKSSKLLLVNILQIFKGTFSAINLITKIKRDALSYEEFQYWLSKRI